MIEVLLLSVHASAAESQVVGPDPTYLWIGILGALGGSLVTGLIGLTGTWLTERSKSRSRELQERRDDSLIKRKAFAAFLDASLRCSNEVSIMVRAAHEAGSGPPSMDALNTGPAGETWREFNRRAASIVFLLDPEGAKTLTEFESLVFREAISAALGSPPMAWNEQIAPLLASMRRALDLR